MIRSVSYGGSGSVFYAQQTQILNIKEKKMEKRKQLSIKLKFAPLIILTALSLNISNMHTWNQT